MQQIDWLEYYTEHGSDPQFDVYGSDWEETLRGTDFDQVVYDDI